MPNSRKVQIVIELMVDGVTSSSCVFWRDFEKLDIDDVVDSGDIQNEPIDRQTISVDLMVITDRQVANCTR
jgi:hypothetical protein